MKTSWGKRTPCSSLLTSRQRAAREHLLASRESTICGIVTLVFFFHNVFMTHLLSLDLGEQPVVGGETNQLSAQHRSPRFIKRFADGGTKLADKTRWFNSSLHYVVGSSVTTHHRNTMACGILQVTRQIIQRSPSN